MREVRVFGAALGTRGAFAVSGAIFPVTAVLARSLPGGGSPVRADSAEPLDTRDALPAPAGS